MATELNQQQLWSQLLSNLQNCGDQFPFYGRHLVSLQVLLLPTYTLIPPLD